MPGVAGRVAELDVLRVAEREAVEGRHLGADRFITDNQHGFPATMTEIAITYPADLPDDTG
jgi:hypothetical protein